MEATQRVSRNARVLLVVTGRTDEELAAAINLDVRRLREKLRGTRGWRLDEVVEVARFLRISTDDLLREPSDLLSVAVNIGRGSPAAAAGRTGMVRAA